MRELRDRLRLALEANLQLRVRGEMIGEDLDGDVAVKARVACVPHFAHTTSAEPRNDLVGTKACTRLNGRHKLYGLRAEYTPSAFTSLPVVVRALGNAQ